MLAHWNNSLQINMSPYSDTLSWFRDNQLTPWCCILSNHGSNQRSTALKESTLTITPQMWLQNQEYCFFKTYESCMFNAAFNNISAIAMADEIRENNWQTIVSSKVVMTGNQIHNFSSDRHWFHSKSNYHMIKATLIPSLVGNNIISQRMWM